MKKHELLKHAYDNYPKGTKFINLGRSDRFECETTGSFYVDEFGVRDSKTGYFIYGSGKWAEIVPEQPKKIAVKVENEKEFSALMKYYESLGWVWKNGDKPLANKEFSCFPGKCKITFKNWFSFYLSSNARYNDLAFQEFAKEHNIKLPLIKSEDGVWLYEGDEYLPVYLHSEKSGWKIEHSELIKMSSGVTAAVAPLKCKAFSTKQAALDWIEAHELKSQKICLGNGFWAIVYKDRFEFEGCISNGLDSEQMHDIMETMKELS